MALAWRTCAGLSRCSVQVCTSRRSLATRAAAKEARLNITKAVDKEHEGKSFKAIAALPPGALQGLKAGKADAMLAAFNVTTVAELGRWKYVRIARAIATLAATEGEGARPPGAGSNIHKAVDKAWEAASLTELLSAPPSALQGLAPWTDTALADLKIKSIKDLAKWKYAAWADAIATAAEFETEDFASR